MRKGQKHSLCSIEKMKISHRGHIPWMKGQKHTEETKEKISKNRKGKCVGNQYAVGNKPNKTTFKKGSMPWNKGKKCPNIAKAILGKKHTEETKKKLSEIQKGKKPNWKCIEAMRTANKGGNSGSFKKGSVPWSKGVFGKESPGWKGGLSFEPYSPEFNKGLKIKIKKRDYFTCRHCGKHQKMGLAIHHIDYNKKNNDVRNLITLCNSCNSLANGSREKWKKYYQRIIKNIYESIQCLCGP